MAIVSPLAAKEECKKSPFRRYRRQTSVLIWKGWIQRIRKSYYLLFQASFATVLFLACIYVAKPVFITPLHIEPEPTFTWRSIIRHFPPETELGFAPYIWPVPSIMRRAARHLGISVTSQGNLTDLNAKLFRQVKSQKKFDPNLKVIWVIFTQHDEMANLWKFTIRSTQRGHYETAKATNEYPNSHYYSGFLAVQLAVSQAIMSNTHLRDKRLRYENRLRVWWPKWYWSYWRSTSEYPDEFFYYGYPDFEVSLAAMPISYLVDEKRRQDVVSFILPCFTLALLPPVLDIIALVVFETGLSFKRSLRIRSVDYSSIYLSWLTYGVLTTTPIFLLGGITLIGIFRWIHLVFVMILLLMYLMIMIMIAFIMAMYHSKVWISCLWCILVTFVMWFPAQQMLHYKYEDKYEPIFFIMRALIPPFGLGYMLNSFATLQTQEPGTDEQTNKDLQITIGSWFTLILFYFVVLMVMERRVRSKVIGAPIPYKNIFFQLCLRPSKLHPNKAPTGKERAKLEEVDERVAKAIIFRRVFKSVSGKPVLNDVTFDVYRGDFTMFFCDQVQEIMVHTIEDLLSGLTYCDEGTIYVLGYELGPGKNLMNTPHMTGYCHRPDLFIDDLTVEEHLRMYIEICLWHESREYINEYGYIRKLRVLAECDLLKVKNQRLKNLNFYYRAQLCWAIALLLEPWIIIIPNFVDHPDYVTVIRDKIMNYKKYLTIVNTSFTSTQLEFADRVFVFDSKVVAFGGTPAYMFYKYGRGYCVRLTLGYGDDEDEGKNKGALSRLLARAVKAGATVGAQSGSLLMLRLPVTPTHVVAGLVQDLSRLSKMYNIASMNVTVADSEEIFKRTIYETREEIAAQEDQPPLDLEVLSKVVGPPQWERKTLLSNLLNRVFGPQLRSMGWKVFSFHLRYKFLIMTVLIIAAIGVGYYLGKSFEKLLNRKLKEEAEAKRVHNDVLTVESMENKTNIVIRTEPLGTAKLFADLYTLSEPAVTEDNISHITYTSFLNNESLVEYLATRAVQSPFDYLTKNSYGLETRFVYSKLYLKILYNTGSDDKASAARSLAKVYTALLRYYTKMYNGSIQVTDDPLYYDLLPRIDASEPPVLALILLILCIVHVTFIPSIEHGLIKHMQSHASNLSPVQYWFTLFFCDMMIYNFLMIVMTTSMMYVMRFQAPQGDFHYNDLLVIPIVLMLYGVTSIPQAYLFSLLGLGVALNAGIYLCVSLFCGNVTVLMREFYGDSFTIYHLLMSFSPQFNFIYAIIKIKRIFLYNGECISYLAQNQCFVNPVNKCCHTCGILERCFKRKSYLGLEGILPELTAMGITTSIYIGVLWMFEYRIFGRIYSKLTKSNSAKPQKVTATKPLSDGCLNERTDVLSKMKEIEAFFTPKEINPFGECLLANKVSKRSAGFYTCSKVYLGVKKGEAVALSGLKEHGRLDLCDIMAGYDSPYNGSVWSMAKYRSDTQPHLFSSNISYSNGSNCLPPWMKVKDALQLIALLRGVPRKHVWQEVFNLIEVLEMTKKADKLVSRISLEDRRRVNFAAAVIGAPPIIVLDEFPASQPVSVRATMYYILHHLKKRKHALFLGASDVESQLPLADKLAIMVDGQIYDVDTIDNLEKRYSMNGYTVVVEFNEAMDVDRVNNMFEQYFKNFSINDANEMLVNVQVFGGLSWGAIFQSMENMKKGNDQVSLYIITTLSIGYVYTSILNNAQGNKAAFNLLRDFFCICFKNKEVSTNIRNRLVPFKQEYDITKVNLLPWSGIFQK